MSRRLAWALVAVMLAVVLAQGWLLSRQQPVPVTRIELHDSRLVPFLLEIREHSPATFDSIVLNLSRIRDGQPQVQDHLLEETVIAEQLLARLSAAGPAPASDGASAPPVVGR